MDGIGIAAAGMQQDLQRLETLSQNMANVLTPGYKKQMVVGAAFAQQFERGRAASAALPPALLALDTTPGTLRYTGNSTDVAIDGGDFFELAGKDGSVYTRQGSFHTDGRGRLVSAQGDAVMGVGGEIVLNGPYSIEANGEIRQDGQVVARLKLVRFEDAGQLQPAGAGAYRQGGARLADTVRPSTLKTGYQENSNVSSPEEMVRLSATVRHFEALQKVMQGYDESLEKTIRKLGEF